MILDDDKGNPISDKKSFSKNIDIQYNMNCIWNIACGDFLWQNNWKDGIATSLVIHTLQLVSLLGHCLHNRAVWW